MDINEIKQLLKNSTAVLIMDNGEPSFVVVNYPAYKDLVISNAPKNGVAAASSVVPETPSPIKEAKPSSGEIEILERINKDIQALKAEIEQEEKTLAE